MSDLDILTAIESRSSIRAFTNQAVPRETLEKIINISARAPSGTNCQPWKVYVVTGNKRNELIQKVTSEYELLLTDKEKHKQLYQEPFAYYPDKWISPYIDRRRQNGWELYGLLDIKKGDSEKMYRQQRRNFELFDAPVGLFFTVDKIMGIGSKMDIAMMIQNIMLAAKAFGLDTCPQAAWNQYHSLILPILGAPENEELVCGMALGYRDNNAVVNTLHTPREDLHVFTTFLD